MRTTVSSAQRRATNISLDASLLEKRALDMLITGDGPKRPLPPIIRG
ncbi:MAG: hypothetical protein ABW169_14125 [Sphingobium sp.]